jgi:DNA topoisomerase III
MFEICLLVESIGLAMEKTWETILLCKETSSACDFESTPMRMATERDLEGDSWRLYDFICRNFLASISPDCTYTKVKVKFNLNGEIFKISGSMFKFSADNSGISGVDPGFTVIVPWMTVKESYVPNFEKSRTYAVIFSVIFSKSKVSRVEMMEKQTSPPDYLTESDLITLVYCTSLWLTAKMEKHGIGTDASIPVHIQNIVERNYVRGWVRLLTMQVQVKEGRRMVPTQLGIV